MRSRDRLLQGEGKFDAFRNVMLVVGPAFVLTHATAGLSFIARQFSKSDLSRTFGEAGLVTTLIAMLAVLTLVPLLGVLLVRNEARLVTEIRGADSAVDVLRRFWIAARMVSRPGLYSLLGVLVSGALGWSTPISNLVIGWPIRYPQAVAASHRLDAKLIVQIRSTS